LATLLLLLLQPPLLPVLLLFSLRPVQLPTALLVLPLLQGALLLSHSQPPLLPSLLLMCVVVPVPGIAAARKTGGPARYACSRSMVRDS
jgi:hypothetical protein